MSNSSELFKKYKVYRMSSLVTFNEVGLVPQMYNMRGKVSKVIFLSLFLLFIYFILNLPDIKELKTLKKKKKISYFIDKEKIQCIYNDLLGLIIL